AGKSTLLHILGGLDEPTGGRVLINDEDMYGLSGAKRALIRNRKIGFVFQFYHLLPEFTALENVMLPAMIGAKRRRGDGPAAAPARENAARVLEMVGLGHRMSHRPGQLSGGEQQRAAIARALINEPLLLLCDEPTGNLDSVSGREIVDLLSRLNVEMKRTVVVVTHEEDISKRTDRVLYMRDGKLQ
ncbi:MAG: ABC transporter ATP-binding protein, partial [Candidatus Omnitrophica bacterium]|nr:ABC transporter ATP-binding protein [Candidatus Omnitrophota bacterium]